MKKLIILSILAIIISNIIAHDVTHNTWFLYMNDNDVCIEIHENLCYSCGDYYYFIRCESEECSYMKYKNDCGDPIGSRTNIPIFTNACEVLLNKTEQCTFGSEVYSEQVIGFFTILFLGIVTSMIFLLIFCFGYTIYLFIRLMIRRKKMKDLQESTALFMDEML